MKLLSKLRMKLANLLSPRGVGLSSPNTSLMNPLTPAHWELLSGLLSLLSSMGPSSTSDSDTIHQLQTQIEQKKLEILHQEMRLAKAETYHIQAQSLPHRLYPPMLYHDGVSWVAVQELANNSTIVGRGDCPQAALVDYDNQWLGIK